MTTNLELGGALTWRRKIPVYPSPPHPSLYKTLDHATYCHTLYVFLVAGVSVCHTENTDGVCDCRGNIRGILIFLSLSINAILFAPLAGTCTIVCLHLVFDFLIAFQYAKKPGLSYIEDVIVYLGIQSEGGAERMHFAHAFFILNSDL